MDQTFQLIERFGLSTVLAGAFIFFVYQIVTKTLPEMAAAHAANILSLTTSAREQSSERFKEFTNELGHFRELLREERTIHRELIMEICRRLDALTVKIEAMVDIKKVN